MGVRFNFKYYSQRRDRSTGQVRNFKVYEADEFHLTPELEQLVKTTSGRQRQVRYNPNWQYLKEKVKEVLQSEEDRHIYGMRRTHLRGKEKVEIDIVIAFMMMNLKKYYQKRWTEGHLLMLKNLKSMKKRSRFLKKKILIVFNYLEKSFFPDTSEIYDL